jgi:predicted GH43/DUF377 family glycosyl hydrolase
MTPPVDGLVSRRPGRLRADPSRVITTLFVPGHEVFNEQDSRTAAVLGRVLAMDDEEAQASYEDVVTRFDGRHRDLLGTFRRHAAEVAHRLDPAEILSDVHQQLVGATFTSEYAIEGAALCNPSIVAHPDQAGVPSGSLRFVMSVRAIGEGHRSSIGFRTGYIDATGQVTIDERPPFATLGEVRSVPLEAAAFHSELCRLGSDGEDANFVLDALGPRFTWPELEEQLVRLRANLATRRQGEPTIAFIRTIAERSYGVQFAESTSLPERVLWPAMGAESHGLEDARFVRFTGDDGSVVYYATYTAYDGEHISQQLLETTDFRTFTSAPMGGPAAANKGLALFPRRVGGRFAALSRCDRETNTLAFSDNPRAWDTAVPCQAPAHSWEVLQLGNCGSPIETEAGWLVLTHAVGPMRTYSIGALLLDLDEPSKILGRLRQPLLRPAPDEQNGYVPNVVYSCGSLVHAGTLVLPYGIGDAAIGIATVPLADLLDALGAPARR